MSGYTSVVSLGGASAYLITHSVGATRAVLRPTMSMMRPEAPPMRRLCAVGRQPPLVHDSGASFREVVTLAMHVSCP